MNSKLTPGDVARLQQARTHIEAVKEAIYSGNRGDEWLQEGLLRDTFNAISRADMDLVLALIGAFQSNNGIVAE